MINSKIFKEIILEDRVVMTEYFNKSEDAAKKQAGAISKLLEKGKNESCNGWSGPDTLFRD